MTPADTQPAGTIAAPFQGVDGEWYEPANPSEFLWGCCDCGLFHRVDFRVVDGRVQLRVTRDEIATQAYRATHRGPETTLRLMLAAEPDVDAALFARDRQTQRALGESLRGAIVRFLDASPVPSRGYRVTDVSSEGMVELDALPGWFAPHLFERV